MSLDVNKVPERVQKGIDWLNENHSNWLELIDLDRLKLDCCSDCILGQVLGDYRKRPVGLLYCTLDKGFSAGDIIGISTEVVQAYYEKLAAEWKKRIQELS